MINRARNKKSIIQNNMGSTDKEVKMELTLPILLWDVERLTKSPSKLSSLADKQLLLNKAVDAINNEKSLHESTIRRLTREKENKISQHRSDINEEKSIKEAEFTNRKLDVENNKIKEIQSKINTLKDKKEKILSDFKQDYNNRLNKIYEIKQHIDKILEENQFSEHIQVQSYQGPIDEITVDMLESAVNTIESEIKRTIEDGMTVNKIWNKVKKFDKKQNTLIGAGMAAATLLAAPVVIVGAGVTAGVTINQNKKALEAIEEYCMKLVQLKEICFKLYNIEKAKNVIDVSEIDNEINETYQRLEIQTNNELLEIKQEEENWRKDYKERLEMNYDEKQTELYEENVKNQNNSYNNKIKELKKLKDLAEENYQKELEKMKFRNTIKDIRNDDVFKLFEAIKGVKKIQSEYLRYKMIKDLDYKRKEDFISKTDITDELKAQIEYDEELFTDELIPLKNKIELYQKEGLTEEVVSNKLHELLEKETPQYILDTNILHLGKLTKSDRYANLDESEELFAEDWDNSSVIFTYRNEEEESFLINYIKYLSFQIMGSMHPGALEINIINPERDTRFNDILIDTTTIKDGKEIKNPPFVTNYSGEQVDKITQNQLDLVTKRYNKELIGGKALSEIVREKRKLGSKTPKFVLNILHRTGISSPLLSLNENSKKHGIINFVLLDRYSILKLENDGIETIDNTMKNKFKKDKIIIEVAALLNDVEGILNIYQKNSNRYKQVIYKTIDRELISDNTKFFEDKYKKALKLNSITMVDEFITQILGDKLWSGIAEKELRLYFGYVDGDKSKPLPIIIDEEARVHAFMGGTTGGGKSVTLAMINNVLKAMYPPSELEIYYYDFKKVEVTQHIKPYKWPNATAMSASETGDYFISLMEDFRDEMMQRYMDMETIGVTKLSKYRQFMRNKKEEFIKAGEIEKAKKVRIPPRVLIIIDEVQQAFTISDDITDRFREIAEDILRLARAAGMHMFFVSQDPGNKIPANVMDLFTIRACTKATPNVSQAVLRNNFAGLPENQFIGFLGVNTSPTGENSENIQYVVPLAEPTHSALYGKIVYDMAEKSTEESGNRSKNAILYNDNDKYTFKKLDEYLEENELNNGEIILGDIVKFQRKYEPAKIELKEDQIQGINFISTDSDYKEEFFRTVMKSINKQGGESVIFFSSDYDSRYNPVEYVKKPFTKRNYYLDIKTDTRIDEYIEIAKINEEIQNSQGTNTGAISRLKSLEKLRDILTQRKASWDPENGDWQEKYDNNEKEIQEIKDKLNRGSDNPANRYMPKSEERYYFSKSDYGKKPTFSQRHMPDMSFTGLIKQLLESMMDEHRKLKREQKKYNQKFIIVIDPEKDSNVMQDNDWKDKGFAAVVNEASSYGIFLITITSNFPRVSDTLFNKYWIGIQPGPDASMEKAFKKLESSLTMCANVSNPTENFKFKLPTDRVQVLMPWER